MLELLALIIVIELAYLIRLSRRPPPAAPISIPDVLDTDHPVVSLATLTRLHQERAKAVLLWHQQNDDFSVVSDYHQRGTPLDANEKRVVRDYYEAQSKAEEAARTQARALQLNLDARNGKKDVLDVLFVSNAIVFDSWGPRQAADDAEQWTAETIARLEQPPSDT